MEYAQFLVYYLFVNRRRVTFGLLEDPSNELSDSDLLTVIRQIREDAPYSGVQMIYGGLRAKGIKTSREKVRQLLRSVDPLAGATRWPAGLTRRRPYSVPGPNSLWHIGI